ncbi:MAG: hypothetical protein RBR67_19680 [Desulfobacterium sp.]|nr:hypothetical protein [Desulfobacterium sp.]
MKTISKGICLDCVHHDTCKAPCFLATAFINENAKQTHERISKSGKNEILVVYGAYEQKFKNFSKFEVTGKEGGDFNLMQYKSAEDVQAFWDGLPYHGNSLAFCVFIDKFFNKMGAADLAIKYDISTEMVFTLYQQARTSIFEFLDNWNNGKKKFGRVKQAKANMKNFEKIPKRVQAFLLYHCFDFNYSDIGEIIVSTKDAVGVYIRLVKKDLKAGVSIIKFDEDMKPVPINHMDKSRDRQEKTQGALNN